MSEDVQRTNSAEPTALELLNPQQALRDSEAQHRAILEAAVDAILTIDERGTIKSVNPAAERLFGYAANELIGHNVNILMPQPYAQQHDGYLENYRRTGERKIIGIGREVQGKRKDGSVFPIDLAVSEVKLGDRRMFTGIVRDITLRKQAEQELLQTREAALAASKAKDRFIAVVSHELRTPLVPVLATVSFLESQSDLPSHLREELVTIRRNVEHEARLVDDLLDLTRIARGKIELHQEAVAVHELLHTLMVQYQREIDDKGLTASVVLQARQQTIWVDPTRIRQVLTNLLDNAIKFTAAPGHITLRTSNTGNGQIQIEITDTGIGVEPDVLQRLFSPFEQGEQTITRTYGGLGLGLAISRGIVEMHHGKLAAHSEGKGKGASFVLELATISTVPAAPLKTAAPWRPGPKCRVLLVEDHVDTLRAMAKLLRALGYEVIQAGTIAEASQMAGNDSFDVLVSDIGLPDGSGLDLMQQLSAGGHVKGIALSGYGMDEDIRRSKAAGFAAHLVKPIDIRRLEEVIGEVVSHT